MESNILQSLLSNDNNARRDAEATLLKERSTNPANLLNTLIDGMKNADLGIASLAALMYKKLFLDGTEAVSEGDLELMKNAVMQTMDFSQPLTLLKRKGDIISKIYAKQNKSEDLLKLLVEWAASENTKSRQFAMYLFEVLSDCHLTPEQLTTYKDSFMNLFSKSFTDREVSVRVAAFKATTSFLTSMDDSDLVMQYVGIIPAMLNTVVEALKENEEQGRQALESMIELTNIYPELWKNSTNSLVNVISQVMMQKTFEEGTRSTATEVILALASQMPASLRKIDETRSLFIPALVQMLTEVEEDDQTWATSVEEKEISSTDPHSIAVNAINRISTDLGEKTILATCTALIQNCVKSANWKERQAGYMLMGLISEACKESMKKNMDEAMRLACAGIMDPHMRVRYAGLSCLGLLLTELSPKAQKKYHAELMPVLLKMMKEESLIKVQCHAVSTIINFAKGLVEDEEDEEETVDGKAIMEQYSTVLFESLIVLLKKGIDENYEPLQEEVMALLSVVASLIENQFAVFYGSLMPMMEQILTNVGNSTMQQMTLRGRTIEAMGFMIEAVAESKEFTENVQKIAAFLITLLNSGLTNDDPQILAIKETLSKISYYLKENFHGFMGALMPSLINDTKLDIDIKMENADLATKDGSAGLTFKMKGFEGNQRISMNTSALESKIAAFKLISSVSENMGTSFAPYAEVTLPIMIENLSYVYSKAIRKYAMETILNIQIAVGEPNNVTLFKNILPFYVTLISKNIEREDVKELKVVLKNLWLLVKNLNETNQKSKNYMTEADFNTLGPLLSKVLAIVKELKTKTLATFGGKNAEFDEEDMENFKEDLAKVCKASTYVMEISGQLVLNFGESVANMVKSNILNYFALNLNNYKNISESELLDATCFFCDFIEYSYHTDANMIVELNNKFLEIFKNTESTDVKQTLSYGFGVFSMFIPQNLFSTAISQVTTALTSIISEKDSMSEDKAVATENAIGALGKVIYFQKDNSTITDQTVMFFLSKLPLVNEEEEAQKSHKFFFEQILKNNTNVINDNTKAAVMEACMRIKNFKSEDVKILNDEGMELLSKIL